MQCLYLFVIFVLPAQSSETLKVQAIGPMIPLVCDDGTGFAIDIWNEVIKEAGLKSSIALSSFDPTFDEIKQRTIDAMVGGITITDDRESIGDFTQPFMRSGLRIAVNSHNLSPPSFTSTWLRPEILRVFACFIVMLFVSGGLLWVIEHKKGNVQKISDGIHLAQASASTQGFGDHYPVTLLGRFVVAILAFVGAGMIADIQSTLSSVKTANRLISCINDPSDLANKIVGVKRGTTSETEISRLHAVVRSYDDIQDAYKALENGEVVAVVYDSPNVLFSAKNNPNITVVGSEFAPQEYGFMLTQGSPFEERISRALLRIKENGRYEQIYQKWFE